MYNFKNLSDSCPPSAIWQILMHRHGNDFDMKRDEKTSNLDQLIAKQPPPYFRIHYVIMKCQKPFTSDL